MAHFDLLFIICDCQPNSLDFIILQCSKYCELCNLHFCSD